LIPAMSAAAARRPAHQSRRIDPDHRGTTGGRQIDSPKTRRYSPGRNSHFVPAPRSQKINYSTELPRIKYG